MVCHLTSREARKFERSGRVPDCSHHGHVRLDKARAMVGEHPGHGASVARWVGAGEQRICSIPGMGWKRVRSVSPGSTDGPTVLQRVRRSSCLNG